MELGQTTFMQQFSGKSPWLVEKQPFWLKRLLVAFAEIDIHNPPFGAPGWSENLL